MSRRFPSPWTIEQIPGGYVVKDATKTVKIAVAMVCGHAHLRLHVLFFSIPSREFWIGLQKARHVSCGTWSERMTAAQRSKSETAILKWVECIWIGPSVRRPGIECSTWAARRSPIVPLRD